jgi:hypothetical protein
LEVRGWRTDSPKSETRESWGPKDPNGSGDREGIGVLRGALDDSRYD